MTLRREYQMTDDQLKALLEACKSVPMIALQCGPVSNPQENANRAWKKLGDEMGFDHMTVRPIAGKDQKCFTAEAVTGAV